MNLMGVVIYSHRSGLQDRLEQRFVEEEIPLLSVTLPKFSWRRRTLLSADIAMRYPEHTLIFLDAWDTMMLGSREELETLPLDEGVTFAAQKFCWPDHTQSSQYDEIQDFETIGPWRFINSNPMAGLGRNIAAAIEWGWERFPIKTNTNSTEEYDVDERFLANLYLSEAREKFNIKLDNRCELNQMFLASVPHDLWLEDGRITNLIHRTKPIFVHFNGRSKPPEALLCKNA
jgi:hypothetical protein